MADPILSTLGVSIVFGVSLVFGGVLVCMLASALARGAW